MNKFNKLYLQIINEYACPQNNKYTKLTKGLKNAYPIKSNFLDTFNIINETIKSVELTPVPDEVLIECYKNLKEISTGCFKISYKTIDNIINNSDYLLSETFSICLQKYAKDSTGNLYIFKGIIPTFNDIINKDIKELEIFKRINNVINDEDRVYQFISNILNAKNPNGLTIIKRDLHIEKYKDCFIFINQINDNFKDTLEHEFTHFIQRICNFDPSLPKVYVHKIDNNLLKNFYKAIQQITSKFKNKINIDQYEYSLYQFLIDKLRSTEQHQTIKSMIKFFIRLYEKDTQKYVYNHKLLSINQIENKLNKEELIKFRLNWLNQFLSTFNTFLNLEKYLNKEIEHTFDVKKELFYLIYLAVKYEYIEYDIDNILKYEFENFKFRDF